LQVAATKPKVCIYAPVDESGESHRFLQAEGCEVIIGELTRGIGMTREALIGIGSGADVLMGATIRGGLLDRDFFEKFPDLRVVSKYTIGIEDVDLEVATDLGVIITHCPTEANWGGVAEGTLGFILALLKRLRERDAHVKKGGWRSPDLRGIYLGRRRDGYTGITVGIVGLGRVGSRVADLLAPWRVRILACDPYIDHATFVRHDSVGVDLPTLLRESDVVTLHCSLNMQTRGLIGKEELALMKLGAVLVNTARGAMLDLDALCDALEENRLIGAALDVLPEEPPEKGARVCSLGDKVILSPHMISANGAGTLAAAIPWATEATLMALKGNVPNHVCNVDAVPKWKKRFGGKALI